MGMNNKKVLLRIRDAKASDAAGIASIYSYYVENTTVSFEIAAPTPDEMESRIKRYTIRYPWIVLEADGVMVGYAYASSYHERASYRFTVEISIYLSKDHRNEGYGRILADELLARLKQRGFFTVIVGITATNQDSIRFFTKLGFSPCAEFIHVGYKYGEWLSVMYMQKPLQSEYSNPPTDPVFSDQRNS